MLNIIRADLYRIFKNKGFYITIILLLGFLIIQTATSNTFGLMGNSNMTSTIEPSILDDGTIVYFANYEPLPQYMGSTAPFQMMGNTDILLYFLLPFIIYIAAADFSTNTVKNILSNGMPRIKYYFSKLILSFIFCFFILFINIVVPIITATILRGFDGTFDINFILRLLRPFSAQLFMCFAVSCVGLFFVFATKKTAAVNVTYIAFCILPIMIMSFFIMANDKFEFLYQYDIVMNLKMLAGVKVPGFNGAESTNIIRAFIIGGIYMLASIIGGIAIFKKSEIK